MATFSGNGIDPAVVERMLDFLNGAQTVDAFTSLNYLNDHLGDYNASKDPFMNDTVAQNILDQRADVGGEFTDVAELSGIDGLTQGLFDRLVDFFSGKLPRPTRRFPKTDLFRFMTVHAPKAEAVINGSDDFVTYSNDGNVAATFSRKLTQSPSAAALQKQFSSIWETAQWIVNHRNTLTAADLADRIQVNSRDRSSMHTVWEVLANSVDRDDDPALRQTALTLLAGNHVIRLYNAAKRDNDETLTQNAHWRRLANATVVLPENFSREPNLSPVSNAPQRAIPSRDRKHRAQHDGLVATQEVDYWKGLLRDFEDLDKRYSHDRANAEASAYQAYTKQVDPIFKKIDANWNQQPDGSSTPRYTTANEDDVENYPYEQIPEFSFSYVDPLSDKYTSNRLTNSEALRFIEDNRLESRSVKEATDLIQLKIREAKKRSGARFQKKVGKLRINTVPTTARPYYSYAFSMRRFNPRSPQGDGSVYFSFNAGYDGAFFKNFTVTARVGGTTLVDRSPVLLRNENGSVFVHLFTKNRLPLNEQGTYNLSFEFALDNGKKFQFEKDAHMRSDVNNGVATPLNKTTPPPPPGSNTKLYGVSRLGIAKFRKVEQELCCYVPGEVSHIENIMAREYKERATRNLRRSEDVFEITSEREAEELTDTTTTNRFEMNSEVAEVLKKDMSTNIGFNASVEGSAEFPGGSVGFSAGGSTDFTFANSTQTSNKDARTYGEEVMRRALERIVQKTTTKRTSTMIKEFEENYKHGYDNREGDQHVTGVYRWVDKVYKNQVVDYGKRLMYEFMIPEPAEFFHQVFYALAEEGDDGTSTGSGTGGTVVTIEKPTTLQEQGINSADDISRSNYQNIAAIYGASVSAPMDEFQNGSTVLSGGVGGKNKGENKNFPLTVPAQYECISIEFDCSYSYIARSGKKAHISISGAGHTLERKDIRGKGNGTLRRTYPVSNIAGQIMVNVNTFKISSYSGTANIVSRLSASAFDQWQQMTYDAILSAYEQKLQAYNDAVAQAEAEAAAAAANEAAQGNEATDPTSNSALNTQLIVKELKRLAIEMLTRPFDIQMGAEFYQEGECDVPELMLGQSLDDYAKVVKFFEQAFDWQLMAYLFYPYYWAKRCDWAEMMKRQNGKDYIFEQFLQAGMSRVVVPIRPGFEKSVVFFLKTGQVWTGTGITINDPLYLSILEELAEPEGEVIGDPWYTTVPSTLNIIQGQSVYLAEEGLPCCKEDKAEHGPTNLLGDNNLLEGKEE